MNYALRLLAGHIEAAMRWVAVAHIDKNTCKPCKDNNGTLYRNRQSAYADYPGGEGYIRHLGNTADCRCVVKKRRSDG